MYRTVEFKSAFPDDTRFDESGEPIVPGGRELTDAIVRRLRDAVISVSEVDQHEHYGWGFVASTERGSFYNVVNPVGEECYLTASMNWYFFKMLLFRRPRNAFEEYCSVLTEILQGIHEVSSISWENYHS